MSSIFEPSLIGLLLQAAVALLISSLCVMLLRTVRRQPLVSRLHCQLTSTADSLHVKDLGSTNGTFVNGKKVQRVTLTSGDKLKIGRVEFVVNTEQTDPGGRPKTTWTE